MVGRAANYLQNSTCLSVILNVCPTLKTVLSPQTNCRALNKPGKYFLQSPWDSPSWFAFLLRINTHTPHNRTISFFPPELPSRCPFLRNTLTPGSPHPRHPPNPSALAGSPVALCLARVPPPRRRDNLSLSRARASAELGQAASSAACPGWLPRAARAQGRARRADQDKSRPDRRRSRGSGRECLCPRGAEDRRRAPGDHPGRQGRRR